MRPISRARAALASILSIAVLVACAACDGIDGPTHVSASEGTIRLADLLEIASIRSPLTEVRAASTLQQLGDIHAETVFSEDFRAFDVEAAGWPASPLDRVVEADGGRSFLVQGRDHLMPHLQPRAWTIEAEPNTHYVFERRVRTGAPLVADFEILEADKALDVGSLFGRSEQALRRVHWPPSPEPDDTWQNGSVSFFTMPDTRALVVVLWATPRRSAELSPAQAVAEPDAWFDDIRVSRLYPSPAQSIALLKSQYLADGADPALGMEKRGQFPPVPLVSKSSGRLIDNFSYRYALYTPPPTELGFAVALGNGAALRFSICLSRETRPEHAALFEVLVQADGLEELLWSQTLAANPREWVWHEAAVDLSAYAGRSVTLVLRTSAVNGDPHPMWANPVIDEPFDDAGPRNVILIAVDTLRADRMSCYGNTNRTSPRIDELAADGVRFEHVVSNSTWTCPSFASILTGVVPSTHGVWVAGPLMPLPQRFETLAERLRAHNWATYSIAYKAPLYASGYDQGFDVSVIVPRRVTDASQNLQLAMDWLNSHVRQRNFLFLHFNDPHQPFSQPPPFDSAFGPLPDGVELPFNYHGREEIRDSALNLYDGEIAYVDDRIGAFLDELKSRGLYDDAVIVFVSDHGEEFWEHGGFGHSRGKLYDEAIRVPLIVKPARGHFTPGRVVETQVRAFDVMPTLLELAGVPPTPDLDARSLVPLLAEDAPDRPAVIETWQRGFAVRTRDWKYILEPWRSPGPTESFYDLRVDPAENHNIVDQRPDTVERARRQVLDYVMLHRPGRYVVIIGSESAKHHAHEIRGVVDADSIHGIPPGPVEDETVRFDGESSDALVVVATLAAAGPVAVGPIAESGHFKRRDFRRYSAGDLGRLLRAAKSGVFLFEGPSPAADEIDPTRSMDQQQLETLRALGYLGEDENTD